MLIDTVIVLYTIIQMLIMTLHMIYIVHAYNSGLMTDQERSVFIQCNMHHNVPP